MELNSVFYGVVLLVLSCSLSEARSLGSKVKKVTKRQVYLWENSCPPMAFVDDQVHNRTCTDTCITDDYCTGRQLCCLRYGCKTCMDPVLPPPVVDWVGGSNRGFTDGYPDGEEENTISLKEPHYEEVVCFLDGQTYSKGVFYKGCRKCVCNEGGYVTCEVHCKGDKKVRPTDEEQSGSGDEEDDSSGKQPIKKESWNGVFPFNFGEKEDKTAAEPNPIFLALEKYKEAITKEPENTSGDNDGDDKKNGVKGEGDDDNNVEHMKQRHTSNVHKITTHDIDVYDLPKHEDIFLA